MTGSPASRRRCPASLLQRAPAAWTTRPSGGSPTPSSPRAATSSSGHRTTPRPRLARPGRRQARRTGPPTWRAERSRPGWEPVDTAGTALRATGIGRTTQPGMPAPATPPRSACCPPCWCRSREAEQRVPVGLLGPPGHPGEDLRRRELPEVRNVDRVPHGGILPPDTDNRGSSSPASAQFPGSWRSGPTRSPANGLLVGPGQRHDFQWLAPTAANLTLLKISVPAGFRQVTAP
jgi:hypothetical protein